MRYIKKKLKPSLESKFSDLARSLNKKNKIKYSLGLGEPAFNTPNSVINEAYKAMKLGFTRYSNPLGLKELIDEIKYKSKKENNIYYSGNSVIVTPGAKMALTLALMSILKRGDEVIYFSPCYPSYLPQIILANDNVKPREINLEKKDLSLNFEKLKKKINSKTKAIIINSPHNPSGRMLSFSDFKNLERILKKFPKCFLITDEIYEKLNFSSKKHISAASIKSIKNRTFTINGFSKSFSMTGWRIGYCIANQKLIKKMSLIQQHINTNVPTFTQKAAIHTFKINLKFLKKYNLNLLKNYNFISDEFKNHKNIKVLNSDGGLFCFIDISNLRLKSDKFCYKLLKQYAIAATPGLFFGDQWNNFIRISLAIDNNKFKSAIKKLKKFVNNLKS